jgi:hypothetical protein
METQTPQRPSEPPHDYGAHLRAVFGIFRLILKLCRLVLIELKLWPRPVSISDLKFPVLLLRSDMRPPSFALMRENLTTIDKSALAPVNQTIIIDSDFRQFVQSNVRCRQGDISMIVRALIPTERPFTYSFSLKRRRKSGLAAALRLLTARLPNAECSDDQAQSHRNLARQTTMAGIMDALPNDRSAQ